MKFKKKEKEELKSNEIRVLSTYRYRIFNSSSINFLNKRKLNVNYLFNFINGTAYEHLRKYSIFLSKTEHQSMVKGSSFLGEEDFGFDFQMHSKTAQLIAHEVYNKKQKTKARKAKAQLNFRRRKDEGWIPFGAGDVKISMPEQKNRFGTLTFMKKDFKFKAHRLFPEGYELKDSCFSEDNKGNWYVNFTIEFVLEAKPALNKSVGVDLNLSEHKQIVCSDGKIFGRKSLTKSKEEETAKVHWQIYKIKYSEEERKLAKRKKELQTLIYSVSSQATEEEKTLHKQEVKELKAKLKEIWKQKLKLMTKKEKSQKIARLKKLYVRLGKIEYRYRQRRSDFQHKTSREIVNSYDEIYIGDGLTKKLSQTKMAKSYQDIAPGELRLQVTYKAYNAGYFANVRVNEAGSTFTCRSCLSDSGPKGIENLHVREWTCPCGKVHDRDVNSGGIIEDLGQGRIHYDYKEHKIKVGDGTVTLANLKSLEAPKL